MLNIPKSTATVDVQLINTTTSIIISSIGFVEPLLPGHEFLHLPTFCFLIRHRASGRAVLFDCGSRKNWRDLPPSIVDVVAQADISVEKSVDEILVEGGYDLKGLNSIIWSHWHWDHVGDASRFHPSTEIVVGPSFKENFMPGYPIRPEAQMLESDFENRNVREIEFSGSVKFGDFPAFDFFGDGSFYLLDVPGHAVGHMAALARTTEDTFIFMAGDTCHFPGTFRPSPCLTLPQVIPTKVSLDARFPRPCPSSCFTSVHRDPAHHSSSPFYRVSQEKGGWYVDPEMAQASVDSLEEFDGDENILVVIAHDVALLEVTELFPNHNMNMWKETGWKERFAWSFLNELPSVDGRSR